MYLQLVLYSTNVVVVTNKQANKQTQSPFVWLQRVICTVPPRVVQTSECCAGVREGPYCTCPVWSAILVHGCAISISVY